MKDVNSKYLLIGAGLLSMVSIGIGLLSLRKAKNIKKEICDDISKEIKNEIKNKIEKNIDLNKIEKEIESITANKINASINKTECRFEELQDKIEKEIKDFKDRLNDVEEYDSKIWKTIGCSVHNISKCFEKDNSEDIDILEEKNRHAEEMKDKEIEMEKIKRGFIL